MVSEHAFFWQERGSTRPLNTAVCMGLQDSHAEGRIKQCSKQPAIKQPTVAETALPCFSLRPTRPLRGKWRAGPSAVLRYRTADFQAYVRALEHAHPLPLFLSVFDLLFGSPAPCRLILHKRASTSFAYVNHKVHRPSHFMS